MASKVTNYIDGSIYKRVWPLLQSVTVCFAMSDLMERLTGEWTTSVLPTKTTLTHIDPTNVYGIIETIVSISSAFPTVTKNLDLYQMARAAKGARASLMVISAQNYIATATQTQELPKMTLVIWNSTMELQDLEKGFNLYQMEMSFVANLVFAVVFGLLFVLYAGIGIWKKHGYFTVCVAVGMALEVAGYTARIVLIGRYLEKLPFLCQIISLTLAPAFIMAGVYFLLAQLVVVHGLRYSVIRPLWFCYIFIFCDLSSLAIQAGGGGTAAIRLQMLESTTTGTHVMLAGIAFQVFSMTLFLYLLFDFLFRLYFRSNLYVRFLIPKLFGFLFQTKSARATAEEFLQPNYNQKYRHVWSRRKFGYYPLVLFWVVFFIYIRCVYRLVELSEGWTGYLITHEEYVMTLDGLMVLITCILLVPFHPGFIMGAKTAISMADMRKLLDMESRVEYSLEKHLFDTLSTNESYFAKKDNLTHVYEFPVSSRDTLVSSSPVCEAPHAYPAMQTHVNENPFVDSGIISVPYDSTTAYSTTEVPQTLPKNNRKSRKLQLRSSNASLADSRNPYERQLTGKLASFGPYEQYPEVVEESRQLCIYDGDYDDVESQITHDEFLFSFGKY